MSCDYRRHLPPLHCGRERPERMQTFAQLPHFGSVATDPIGRARSNNNVQNNAGGSPGAPGAPGAPGVPAAPSPPVPAANLFINNKCAPLLPRGQHDW